MTREPDRAHPDRPFLRTLVASGPTLASNPVQSVVIHHGEERAFLRLTEGRWHIHPLANRTMCESRGSFDTEAEALAAYGADPDKYVVTKG